MRERFLQKGVNGWGRGGTENARGAFSVVCVDRQAYKGGYVVRSGDGQTAVSRNAVFLVLSENRFIRLFQARFLSEGLELELTPAGKWTQRLLPSRRVLKLDIHRELDPPRPRSRNWRHVSRLRHCPRTKYRVNLSHIDAVPQIECLPHQIETRDLAMGKNFNTRKSMLACAGVRNEFRPKLGGRADNGNA